MLSKDDRDGLERVLQPMVDATKDQAESLRSQANSLSNMGERMASVETNVGHIRQDLADQKKHCQDVTADFAKEFRKHESKIATNKVVLETACGLAKRLSARAWAFLVSLVVFGITSIVGLVLWFIKSDGGSQ